MNQYADPAKQIEHVERRTVGCYACTASKYENGRSFCQFVKDGFFAKDYPHESKDTCQMWIRKEKK